MAVFFLPKSRLKKFLERTDPNQDVMVINVSNTSSEPWKVLSATFSHGEIPVPGMPGSVSRTIEGLWEGLKRFEHEGENLALLEADKPKKRKPSKATGEVIGWVYGGELLRDEVTARYKIFVPAYTWMLKHAPEAKAAFEQLVELSKTKTLHLYDGAENGNLGDPRPYSHAALLAELLNKARKQEAALV